MGSKFTELVIDCADPARVADFWAAVLGWPKSGQGDEIQVAGPPGSGPSLFFARVPEPKTLKNRLHIDVNPVGCDQADEVQRLIGLGARHADVGQGDVSWVVLADPEGNEFCVLADRRP